MQIADLQIQISSIDNDEDYDYVARALINRYMELGRCLKDIVDPWKVFDDRYFLGDIVDTNTALKSFMKLKRNQSVPAPPSTLCDFLGAEKMGKRFLLGSYGKGFLDVENLRGKTIGLYFARFYNSHVPSDIIQIYNSLKLTKYGDSFEMVFVLLPPYTEKDHPRYDVINSECCTSQVFNHVMSFVPFPSVHFADEDWRSHILALYGSHLFGTTLLTFIHTRDNAVKVLSGSAMSYLLQFGPQAYPFTMNRIQKLKALHQQLPKKTSIVDILGSESRDYLIDRHLHRRIPISRLQDMDVLLYACHEDHDVRLIKYLGEIYSYYWGERFEIVSIPLDYNGGPQDEKVFNESLAETPWLSLPLGDDKIWSLRDMMSKHQCAGEDNLHPLLFIKPRGESLLDPYGCHVIKKFGIQPYPFTRRGVAHSLMIKQKKLTFKSFVKTTRRMSLKFNSLIRNKSDGGTEEVHLSDIIGKNPTKGVLLFFASLETCPKKRLDSLVAAYRNMKKSSSFEVIFISFDKDIQSFREHFSAMPWFAFRKPLRPNIIRKLAERTLEIGFMGCCHFLAFAPAPERRLLKAGLVGKSFDNCDFPFITDAEWTDHLHYLVTSKFGWHYEADGTYTHADNGWIEGIVEKSDEEDYQATDDYWDNGNLPESLLE